MKIEISGKLRMFKSIQSKILLPIVSNVNWFCFTSVIWLQILYAYWGPVVFVEVLIQFRNKLRPTSAHQCIQHLILDDNTNCLFMYSLVRGLRIVNLYLNSTGENISFQIEFPCSYYTITCYSSDFSSHARDNVKLTENRKIT